MNLKEFDTYIDLLISTIEIMKEFLGNRIKDFIA